MALKAFSHKTSEEIYLEYVNDWLTIKSMAANYNRSYSTMRKIIMKAKEEYENRST